jgi:hypothetical protein
LFTLLSFYPLLVIADADEATIVVVIFVTFIQCRDDYCFKKNRRFNALIHLYIATPRVKSTKHSYRQRRRRRLRLNPVIQSHESSRRTA